LAERLPNASHLIGYETVTVSDVDLGGGLFVVFQLFQPRHYVLGWIPRPVPQKDGVQIKRMRLAVFAEMPLKPDPRGGYANELCNLTVIQKNQLILAQ